MMKNNNSRKSKDDKSKLFREAAKTIKNVELNIQVDRIIYLLTRAVDKMRAMGFLPTLLENNASLLKNYLDSEETTFVKEVCEHYLTSTDHSRLTTSTEFTKILTNIKKYQVVQMLQYKKTAELFDPHVAQVIDMIYGDKKLLSDMKDYANPVFDPTILKVADSMEVLTDLAKEILRVPDSQEAERIKQLNNAYKANIEMENEISDLREQLAKQRDELGGQVLEKLLVLDGYSKMKEEEITKFEEKMVEVHKNSEKHMMHVVAISDEKQAIYAVDAKQKIQQYQMLLDEHLEQEKKLRTKRLKIETQLSSWLAKYDQDIGEKQAEYEALKKIYDDEKAEMDQLQELYDQQELEYNTLMREKEEEDEKRFNELAYAFLFNRAARRIQRAWRDYLARKMARRKSRRKKGDAKEKKPKGKKAKKAEPEKHVLKKKEITITKKSDIRSTLTSAFNEDILGDIQNPDAFEKKDIKVDLGA